MTRDELLATKQYLGIEDLCEIFDCGLNCGIKIMREIKSVSDTLGLKGKCTVTDYEVWYERKE